MERKAGGAEDDAKLLPASHHRKATKKNNVRMERPRPYGLAKGLRGYLIRMKRGLRRVSGAYPLSWMTCVKENHQQHKKGTRYP